MGILRSATIVGACTLLSRILGMVRDMFFAARFGTGAAADAFVVAWRIPNLFRRLLGEGALSSAFIPVFSEERERGGLDAAFAFFARVLALLSALLAALSVAGVAVALLLPGSWFGDGASAEKADLTLSLFRILFPYVWFVNVMALFMAVLNSLGHFLAPAIAPALLNVFWIGGVVLAPHVADGPEAEVRFTAWAILAGGVVQLAIQLPALAARRVPLRAPAGATAGPAVRRMLKLMGPMVLGLAPVQLNLLADVFIAEAFVPGDGANSHLFYGNRLMQFPLALIGIAMGVAVFPRFARQAAAGKSADLSRTCTDALNITFFLSLPAAAGLVVLADPFIALIFERGGFTSADTAVTADVLAAYSLGIPAYCALQITTRLFYSTGDVKTPVRIGMSMVLAHLILNLVLVRPLGAPGLALATALTAALNLLLLGFAARRRIGCGLPGGPAILRSALLALGMAVAVHFVHRALAAALPGAGTVSRIVVALAPMAAGGALYLGAAWLLRVPEARRLAPPRR